MEQEGDIEKRKQKIIIHHNDTPIHVFLTGDMAPAPQLPANDIAAHRICRNTWYRVAVDCGCQEAQCWWQEAEPLWQLFCLRSGSGV